MLSWFQDRNKKSAGPGEGQDAQFMVAGKEREKGGAGVKSINFQVTPQCHTRVTSTSIDGCKAP